MAHEGDATVAAVSLKLPPFWPGDPQVWFVQVEAQFATRSIASQKTRFDYIVASLSLEIASEVRDLILQPPAENPYDTLKDQLIKRTAALEQRRLQQLFNTEELGDRKPSQLLRKMQQLLGDKAGATDASFIRELFLQRLPGKVRMVLASTSDTTSIDELAQLADKIVEVAAPSVSAYTNSSSGPTWKGELDRLRTEVVGLKQLIKSLSVPSRDKGYRRSRSRSHSPNPTDASTNTDPSSLCWYHQ